MTVNLEPLTFNILHKFHGFTDGARVMMLINRNEQNTNKGSKRWINKLISFDPDGFEKNLRKLLDLQYHLNEQDIRLYSCVNKRNFIKSTQHFQHKLIDLDTHEEKINFFGRINDRFCSSLMQPENKNEKLFLIDVDDKSALIKIDGQISELLKYETPNGFHVIVSAFDPRRLEKNPKIEIKKDGLLLLNAIGNEL